MQVDVKINKEILQLSKWITVHKLQDNCERVCRCYLLRNMDSWSSNVNTKIIILCGVTLCSPVDIYWHLIRRFCPHFKRRLNLKMEEARSCETFTFTTPHGVEHGLGNSDPTCGNIDEIRAPQMRGKFPTSWEPTGFSRSALIHLLSQLVILDGWRYNLSTWYKWDIG
jgi:hypothetical protein